MSEDPTRLNIERARQALARARLDDASQAVRAPRPADLSRLQENQERAESLSARADAFRDGVRARMGLSANSAGPANFATGLSGMDAALCDADVCAPPAPVMKDAPRSALRADPHSAPETVATPMRSDAPASDEKEPRRRRFFWLF